MEKAAFSVEEKFKAVSNLFCFEVDQRHSHSGAGCALSQNIRTDIRNEFLQAVVMSHCPLCLFNI